MSTKRRPAVIAHPEIVDTDEIARYEAMSDEEVDAELKQYGIDPRPTINAVTALVRKRIAAWRSRAVSARRAR